MGVHGAALFEEQHGTVDVAGDHGARAVPAQLDLARTGHGDAMPRVEREAAEAIRAVLLQLVLWTGGDLVQLFLRVDDEVDAGGARRTGGARGPRGACPGGARGPGGAALSGGAGGAGRAGCSR